MDLHAKRRFLFGLSLLDAWSIVVGFVFIGAGVARFFPATGVYDELAALGVPDWLIVASGVLEMLGGVLLVLPNFRFLGASICGAMMLGATATNLRAEAYADAVSPIVLGLMALSLFLLYRGQAKRLLGRPAVAQ